MNRKDRRAASKQGKGPSGPPGNPGGMPPPPSPTANLFAAAARHLGAGQIAEAERFCRDALTLDPNHADSLHLLGIIACQVGRHAAAVELLGRALAVNARSADCHFNMAHALRALGRLDDAAVHFNQASVLKRDFTAAHLGLGDLLMQQGRIDDARTRYQRALVIEPRSADAHYGLANVAMQQGRLDEATAEYRRVLALKPDFAEACSNLGVVLASQGKLDEAAVLYRRAIALKPQLVDTYRNLGRVVLVQGDAAGALAIARTALDVAETEETKAFFVQCARALTTDAPESDLRHMIARALSEGWSRPGEISSLAANLFKLADAGSVAVARVAAAWPGRLPASELWPSDELAIVSGDPLLRALIEAAPVQDIELERYITAARAALVELAAGPDAASIIAEDALRFFCALARQCFINEYVFAETEEEVRQARQLQDALCAALASGAPVPALWPVAVAAYVPLHSLDEVQALLQRPWPDPMRALLDQQVREPLQELQLRATIPALTTIADEISLAVQRQYEEMPYPRWIKPAPVGRPTTIDWYLCNQFPLAPVRNLAKRDGLDILIAGCGTGQHSIDTAQRFAPAKVLAVDLSLSSLSYAKRKTQELGLANIDYAQADLLQLAAIGRSFDVIEASGVLHHLRDPALGWRTLLSLLRPGGVMNVGLYSAIARADIRAARAFIAERGYGRTAADIRQCRQDLLGSADGTPLKNVSRYSDFFTVSECRDLLFHVQEHQLTIPEIKAFLTDNNLTFLGFANAPAQAYRACFPHDPAMTDLDHWHVFETENPKTFVNMYQFWVQKPAGG
jgi:tetratricopeptide (TPR) repeat protein/2-polyprenyl-3-methyl-5-hydroxy-6-metoxy-1,4-benzoquinol methylase